MRIIVVGDVHGNLEAIHSLIDREDPDLVLCTGDLERYGDFKAPMYFIHGNHEDFGIIEKMDRGQARFTNLQHIKTGQMLLLGQPSVRIAGLGGNYSPHYYLLKGSELPGDRRRHFTQDDVERCKQLRNIDIFLCHEAPAGMGFMKRGKDMGIGSVREVLDALQPKYFIFGHHHLFAEKDCLSTKVISLGRARDGYLLINTGPSGISHRVVARDEANQLAG